MGLFDLPQEVLERLDVLNLRQLTALRFVVQIDGDGFIGKETVAGFIEVDGLRSEMDVRTLREGGFTGVHAFPRKERQPSLTCRRPLTYSRSFLSWYEEGRNYTKGQPTYVRNMSVYLLDAVHLPGVGEVIFEAWRWDFFRCFVSAWQGPKLHAQANTMATEVVTIQHNGLREARGVLSGNAGEILSLFK